MNEAINSFVGRRGVCHGSKLPPAIFRTEAEQEVFLRLVYESGDRVGLIVWHEYCRAGEQIITGMGGYADPLNEGFMWAETQIPCADLDEKNARQAYFLHDSRKKRIQRVPTHTRILYKRI